MKKINNFKSPTYFPETYFPNPDIENTMIVQVFNAPRKFIKNLITNEVTTVFMIFLYTFFTCTIKRISISGFGYLVALNLVTLNVIADDWGVYAGLANQQSTYQGIKNDYDLIFDLAYRINDETQDESQLFYYDIILTTKHSGYKTGDSDVFTGMDKRRISFDIGAQVIMDMKLFPITLELTKDVYGPKGIDAMFKLGGISPTDNANWKIQPSAGVYFQNSKVTDYYFGVKATEVTESRDFYKGKSALTPFIGAELQKDFGKNFTIISGLNYQFRSDEVNDSPLTDDKSYDLKWNVGLVYWF